MIELLKSISVALVDGRYEPLKELTYGMGAKSFLGRDLESGKTVFMKYLLFPSNNYELAKFKNEIMLAERWSQYKLANHNVDYISSESFYDDKVLCLVTEWCDAPSLNKWLEIEKNISLDDRVELVHRVCSGVSSITLGGFCHRDLHPGNIKIENVELDWHANPPEVGVKIIDLGEAISVIDLNYEDSEQFVFDVANGARKKIEGSFYGLPPEIFTPWDNVINNYLKYDSWSMSLLLYKILTGKDLISHSDIGSYIEAIKSGVLQRAIDDAYDEIESLDVVYSTFLAKLFVSVCKIDASQRKDMSYVSRVLWDIRFNELHLKLKGPKDIERYFKSPYRFMPPEGWKYDTVNDPY
ncbi:protein kinase domain-containing protein [Cobetia marina]|uniref:protein kinase domain-containing protein n=1 Tax=Cobetia marina TaxID=28258 RepID=UPI001749A85A